jgi:hypothetical protein
MKETTAKWVFLVWRVGFSIFLSLSPHGGVLEINFLHPPQV